MPGPIQSAVSNLVGTAQVGGIVNKHFKEQAAAAKAEADQAGAQNKIIEHGEAERTKLTQEAIKKSRAEELAKDRQSELVSLMEETNRLGPNESGRLKAEYNALYNAGLNMSFDQYRKTVDKLGPNVGLRYLHAQLSGNKERANALRRYSNSSYYTDPQRMFNTEADFENAKQKLRTDAGQRYREKAMSRVYAFTTSDAYQLRKMYATGKIGSRQELTDKLSELAAGNDFKLKAYGGDK